MTPITHDLEISLNLAVTEAARRGHEYVTVEHILYALLHNRAAARAIRACGGSIELTREKLTKFFEENLSSRPHDPGTMPQPTIGFQRVLQRAIQSVRSAGKDLANGENVLVAIFSERDCFATYFLQEQDISRFDVINYVSHRVVKEGVEFNEDELGADASAGGRILPAAPAGERLAPEDGESADQDEDGLGESDEDPESAPSDQRGAGRQKTERSDPLRQYATDLCGRAREGKIDPLVGRDAEVERTVQILCRRRKNNPLFVGDAGVGKTAIAEGLALRIVEGKVPPPLQGATIWSLEMGTLLAGSRFRGDFEQRMKGVIKSLIKRKKAILFIDEIHTVIGAGAVSGGTLDASNILKPALSSGDIRCIGSTTFKEYRNHFENDHALARRFQKIDVEEPSEEDALAILKGLKAKYEEYHQVKYSTEALKAAVQLSAKYIRDRKLPDKAIDVIDEVGASLALKPRTSRRIGIEDVQAVVAKMARIPAAKVSSTDRESLRTLDTQLKSVVYGQDQAIDAIAAAIRLSRSGLGPVDKPIGSFLFAGPTGVGKTEVAKQLSSVLGIEFIRFDMSEYMERHTVSRMIGAPPGYVGYDQGGLLTDAVNKNPHAVLLFDEIEKAHPDLQNILLQVLDHGTLTDTNGRQSDFRNVIIIMTTNAGARELMQGSIGFTRRPGELEKGESEALKNTFSPEFRNRLDAIIQFQPLPKSVVLQVVDKFVAELAKQLKAKRVELEVSESARNWLAGTGYDPVYGARPLNRLIQDKLKRPLAEELLFGRLARGGKVRVQTNPAENGLEYTIVESLVN